MRLLPRPGGIVPFDTGFARDDLLDYGWQFSGRLHGVLSHRLFNHSKQLPSAQLPFRRTGKSIRQIRAPLGKALGERRNIRLHNGGRHLVGLGKDEDKWNRVISEPFHEFQIDFLRRQSGINQRKDTGKIGAVGEVIGHRIVELGAVLARHAGEPVARQIHQPPGLVHRENVDELGETRRRRNARQTVLARQHVQQRRLADVRAADEGELRQRLVRTRSKVRRAAIKNGG